MRIGKLNIEWNSVPKRGVFKDKYLGLLGSEISRRLEKHKITQASLARTMKEHRQVINALILNRYRLTPQLAYKLSLTLGDDTRYWMWLWCEDETYFYD